MQVHGKTDKCSVKNPRSGSHGKEIQKQHCIRGKKKKREIERESWTLGTITVHQVIALLVYDFNLEK
jgi:hypothetical protein